MSDHYYNQQLYPLQDKVLQAISRVNSKFYLTGGTVLGRYILNHRYSDDLDFFTNAAPDFDHQVDQVFSNALSLFSGVELSSRQDNYRRYFIIEGDIKLKVEFINDVNYRVGETEQNTFGFKQDTWNNILSNKITALGRNAAKDFVDILFLSLRYQFNWEQIISEAQQKDASINEIDVSKYFFDFKLETLIDVVFPEAFDRKSITMEFFETLARESLHGFDNSLFGKKI